MQKVTRISEKQGKSISELVDDLIELLPVAESENVVEQIRNIMAPYIHKLRLPANLNYKEMLSQWRNKDYLKEEEETQETAIDKIRKIVAGKVTDPSVNWKEAKADHLSKKYGL